LFIVPAVRELLEEQRSISFHNKVYGFRLELSIMKNMGYLLFFIVLFITLFLIVPVTGVYSSGQYTKADCTCPQLGVFQDDMFSYAFAGGGGVVCKFSDEDKGFAGEFRFQDFFPQNSDPAQGKKVAQSNFDSKARVFVPSTGSSGKAIFHDQQKQSSMVSYAIEYPPAVKTARPLFTAGKMHLIQDTVLVEVRGESQTSIGEAISRMEAADSCVRGIVGPPQPVPGVQKTLHGNITATIENNIAYPLKHGRLTLQEVNPDGSLKNLQETTTDENGGYEFGGTFEKGKTYVISIELTYSGDKDYFTLYLTSAESDENKIRFPDDFTYTSDSDLEKDINLDTLWSQMGVSMGGSGRNPYGIMYVQFAEALEFYKDYLREDIHLNLPLRIVTFADNDILGRDISSVKAEYLYIGDQGISHIYISREESIAESELAPVNREYHEFSHYMMTNLYGGWPADVVKSDIKSLNHDGYVNPSTRDSWQEGFAHFMSTIIAEHYGYANYGVDGIFGSLELNWKPWESQGYAEEFAIGGILWDLYDSPETALAAIRSNRAYYQKMRNSPDLTTAQKTFLESHLERLSMEERTGNYQVGHDDFSELSFNQIWAVMRSKHPDFTSVYDALVKQYPDKKGDIDEIFEKHGFWKDNESGNGMYDPREPYRDTNRNGTFDQGEYFIDMPSGFGASENIPSFNLGTDTLGTASNYQRPWRRTAQKMPGYFVKVNNAVPFYTYRMEFPDGSGHSYSVTVRNDDGLIYIQVPPGSGAKITVTADGVTTGNPLVFTSGQFNENFMASVQQGYYTSHDFKVSGPIPTPPVIPDLSKGGPAGKQNAGFPDLLSPTSRIPLIVSVPVAIAGLLVLGYVLKKEM
jgi:hypothetical protein